MGGKDKEGSIEAINEKTNMWSEEGKEEGMMQCGHAHIEGYV